jgi:predicted MFS family arabinose efflux permease
MQGNLHGASGLKNEAKHELLLILVLFGTLFLASVDNQLLIPLLPTLASELSKSMAQMGWLFSIYALSAAIFNLFFGPLTDRYGRVPFLRFGLLLFLVLALLTAQSKTYSDLVWLRAGTGLSAGLLSTCTASFIGDYFPYERRGRIMGFVLSSYFAALIFGVPLSSLIAQNWGWRTVFLLSSAIAGILFAGSWLFVPHGPRTQTRTIRQVWDSYSRLTRSRTTGSALLVSACISGGTLAFLTFISGYLNDEFGLDAVAISTVFLIAGLAAVLASPVSGWLSDRWTKRKVFLASNTILALPLFFLVEFEWGVGLFIALFLISLLIAFRQTSLQTLQTQLISFERRGSFLALRNCFSQLGISGAVFLAGILYSEQGYASVTGLAAGLTLIGSLLLFFLISEPEGDKNTERKGGNDQDEA